MFRSHMPTKGPPVPVSPQHTVVPGMQGSPVGTQQFNPTDGTRSMGGTMSQAVPAQHSPGEVHAPPCVTQIGGDGGETRATHEPLVQTPAQHSAVVVQAIVSGWQA